MEFDFCQGAGWMYSINNIYPTIGFGRSYVENGDVVRIRFTLAYGKDIGGASALTNYRWIVTELWKRVVKK